MANITRAALVDAANDLNKVLELDPKIDVKLGVAELRGMLGEAAALVKPADAISDETKTVLAALAAGEDDDKGGEAGSATSGKGTAPAGATKEKTKAAAKPKAEKAPKAAKPEKAPKAEKPTKPTAASRAPRENVHVGDFKPIRRGSRMHEYAEMAVAGKTLDEMAKAPCSPATFAAKDVRWWLCQYLRRHHGIEGKVLEGGGVELKFPTGKTLDDCVSAAAA